MNFIPNTPKNIIHNVPYFEDTQASDGWQGQSTTKSIERLKMEIVEIMERLGATVKGFQSGKFQTGELSRDGYRLHYVISAADGRMIPGQIDIAALPVKKEWRMNTTLEKRKTQSLKMALYMLRIALAGTWFLQQLSPGYSALMPWMLADENKTISQLWGESSIMRNLLPPGEDDFIEGEYRETEAQP